MPPFRRFSRRASAGKPVEVEESHARKVAAHVRGELALTKFEIEHTQLPGVLKWSHVANETGVASPWVQAKKSAQGMEPGVADYFFAVRNDKGEMGTVWIELKKERGPKGGLNGSTISEEQQDFVDVMNRIPNTAAHICHGYDDLVKTLESYIFTK